MLRKFLYCIFFLLLFVGNSYEQVNTWQAQQGYITSIQNQLNNIQNQISSFLLPPSATPGQIIVMNPGGTAYVAVTVTGDINSSTITAGLLTVTGISNSITTKSLSGKTTGSPFGITKLNWNKIIDPSTYGCHGDYLDDTSVIVTSGSANITSVSNKWLPTDCNVIHGGGCTGTTDKVIRIQDETLVRTVFTGTIVGYTSAGAVTISSAPTVVNGNGFQADWATADDTCLSNITAAMQSSTSVSGAIHAVFSQPVAMTTTWVLNHLTGEISAAGCSASGTAAADGTSSGGPFAPFVWFGTTADIPMIQRRQSYGLSLHNLCLIGNSKYPPSFGIDDNQLGGDANNVLNSTRDVQVGGFFGIAGMGGTPQDRGGSLVGALAADANSGTATLNMTALSANFSGPGPDQLILINDLANGATSGSEVVRTSHTYVRGTNPISLSANLSITHPAATSHVLIAFGTLNNGFGVDVSSTQDDKNKWDNIQARNTNTCFGLYDGQVGGTYISGMSCNQTLFGFFSVGVNTFINAPEFEGVGVKYAIANTADVVVDSDNEQQGGGASYGPGFSMSDPGGVIKLIESTLGFTTLTNFICTGCSVVLSSSANANGDIIELGMGQSETIRFIGAILTADSNGALPANVQPAIHERAALAVRDVTFDYKSLSNQYVVVDDPGFADNRAARTYRLIKNKKSLGETPDETIFQLIGSQAATDIHNRIRQPGLVTQTGELTTAALGTSGSILAVACTGGTGGATDYWYRVWWSVNGIPNKVNTTGVKATCVNAPSVANPVSVTVSPIYGADTLHLASATCVDPCVDPGTETEVANQPINGSPSNGFSANTIQDTGAAIGTAMPSIDQTGGAVIAGPLTGNGSWQDKALAANPAAGTISLELYNGATFLSTVTTTGGTTTIANPTCAGIACGAADVGREFEVKILCTNGAGCDTLAWGGNFKVDASAVIPANNKIRTCRFRIVGASEIDQMGACSADM